MAENLQILGAILAVSGGLLVGRLRQDETSPFRRADIGLTVIRRLGRVAVVAGLVLALVGTATRLI